MRGGLRSLSLLSSIMRGSENPFPEKTPREPRQLTYIRVVLYQSLVSCLLPPVSRLPSPAGCPPDGSGRARRIFGARPLR